MRSGVSFGSVLSGEPEVFPVGREKKSQPAVTEKRILVMDNDEIMRTVMRFILGRAGYTVCSTEYCEEAIDSYREALHSSHPFDAVVLDGNRRRGMGVKELLGKLLELDPKAKAIVTGCDRDDPMMTGFREHGFKTALAKPFTSEKLEEVVQTTVNGPHHVKNILLIDDNYYFLTGLSMNLCAYLKHCNILTAGNGARALEIIESIPVDLIVTDLEMPSTDGYELVTSIKKKYPNLPVFAMTGSMAPETEKRVASLGAARCFAKPFGFKELANMVAAELGAFCLVAA
jgi:DNA-binding NtrC family response regulator